MSKGQNFTVIRLSGKTEFIHNGDYLGLLSNISHEYGSAGSNWDRPNMLLLNGKIVVSEGLSEIAWDYGKCSRELHEALQRTLEDKFRPEWDKKQ